MLNFKPFVAALAAAVLASGCASDANQASVDTQPPPPQEQAVLDYAALVYGQYQKAHADALALHQAIDVFLAAPSAVRLSDAKEAWRRARASYGLTEAHRFYGGPIDGIDPTSGEAGPETTLSAWPINEAAIDYVKDNPQAGLVNNPGADLSVKAPVAGTTGYHAVEFLLWGQDFWTSRPGARPVNDYTQKPNADRRGAYLRGLTSRLVDELASLVEAWRPGQDNYRAVFEELPATESLGMVLRAQATLAGFELAERRIGGPLASDDPQNERSRFSDNTHRDYVQNVKGIILVWLGPDKNGGLQAVLAQSAPAAAQDVTRALSAAAADVLAVNRLQPVDKILATQGSEGRLALESLGNQLAAAAHAMVAVGEAAGLEVYIGGE